MTVALKTAPYDAWDELKAYEQQRLTAGRYGACCAFTGTMRDFNEGDEVKAMSLEHYPGMTECQLEAIADEASARWPLLDTLILHRVGDIQPGETIVLTACWSAHRAASFEACRFLMEALKSRAPFWKKETLQDDSTRWVESNTPG
ncbi:molybdenum cofactor biosynthesis protein MoaE [Granulosicoccaceae sp. 1_MG-2023]|nr:molybdenum cofactor biosynthesis protein MoaE [Granulosicoccaceae sp. 1_MG-2023]